MRPRVGRGTPFAKRLISFVVVVAIWELAVDFLARGSLLISPPSEIAFAFGNLVRKGELWGHVGVSLYEFAAGFVLAAVTGIPLGVIMGVSRTVKDYVDPWISALYATPIIALSPLLILAFGVGPASKVSVVWLVAFFPMLINTLAGVSSVPPNYVETARSFGATRSAVFTKVMVPASLPFIVSGLRLAVGRGLIGVVVGEIFGSRAGLGYLIETSAQVFDTATMFVGVISFAVLGVVGTGLVQMVENYLAPWRKQSQTE